MKSAGEILSALFDERFLNKAQGYSKFFDSWNDITEKNGIAAASAHSRIKDLDKGIVLIEMDHPGWKQIIQTKQSKILNDFRIRFPQLDISGISLILGNSEQSENKNENEKVSNAGDAYTEAVSSHINNSQVVIKNSEIKGYDAIKDEEFKETLKKLERTITEREKR